MADEVHETSDVNQTDDTLKAASDTDTDRVIVSLSVDKFIWNYIKNSQRFSADVKHQISLATDVLFEDQSDGTVKLALTGNSEDRDRLNDIVDNIKQMIHSCEKTVESVKIPKHDASVFSQIFKNKDTLSQSISCPIVIDGEDIVVTGTKEEIDRALGLLEELYGLKREITKDSSVEHETAGSSTESVSVEIDTGLWQYMKKQDGQCVKELDQVRDNAKVQITETLVTENDGVVTRIELHGLKASVDETKAALQKLIDQCSKNVRTLRSGKLDDKVFTKVSKFLSVLSKTGAVVTGNDCIISVTGTDSEIKACQEKLEKLNVSLKDERAPSPPPSSSTSSAATSMTSSQSDLPKSGAASTSARADGGRKHLYIPFPIEEPLWTFMQKRRSGELQQLRDVCMVELSTVSGGEPGSVTICLSGESDEMLEIAQDSLMQIVHHLNQTIAVQVLETDGRSIPAETTVLLNQLIVGVDATIECLGNRIIIIGTREGIGESQQRLARFSQQQQQQLRGPGGVYGAGGDMGMMQGMDMESGPGMRLGGRGLSGTNESDIQIAMRNQRNMQLGGHNRGPAVGPQGLRSGGFAGQGMYGQDDSETMGGMDGYFGSSGPSFARSGASSFDESVGMNSESQRVQITELMDDDDDDLEQVTRQPSGSRDSATDRQQGAITLRDSHGSRRGLPGSSDQEQPGSAASKHRVRFADEQAVDQRGSASSSSTTAALHTNDGPSTATQHTSKCSVCVLSDHDSSASDNGRCAHSFCVSCVKEYFSSSSTSGLKCPVCGSDNEQSATKHIRTQPNDGRMLVSHDSSFRLPGFENKSRGTITVVYSFPPGIQKDQQPHPGQKYGAVTKTAFFPMNPEGSAIVDQLQRAFDDGLVFAMVSGKGQADEINWNGIDHKTNIFGGPQLQGYPDPIYMQRVHNQLKAKGIH